jgi:6-phosphogluconate dehydrogenase (decarboxylating)
MILNPKDNKTLRNLMAKFYKDRIVWIIVPIKKAHNYILRAKVMELIEPKVKGEPVAYNKANEADLPLNNLLIGGVDSIEVIIKKEPQLSLAVRFSKLKKV